MENPENVQLWHIIVFRENGSAYYQTSRFTSEQHAAQLMDNIAHAYGGAKGVSHTSLLNEEQYKKWKKEESERKEPK